MVMVLLVKEPMKVIQCKGSGSKHRSSRSLFIIALRKHKPTTKADDAQMTKHPMVDRDVAVDQANRHGAEN